MSCIKPLPGHSIVSIDLSAGEPTVTAHFSQDKNYRYATFDGVGKEPQYRAGVLMIDDIYLMTRSVSPISKMAAWKEFTEKTYDGLPFPQAWLRDPDLVKRPIKKDRDLHKMLALALGYGMGPKKMVKQCYDKGHEMSYQTARDFYGAYWDLFSGVRAFADQLAARIKRNGFIVNPFGYRLTPPPHKAFNYYIQSSVSGIMHIFNMKLFTIANYAKFITVIHDEVIADVPDDRLDDFRKDAALATKSLNDDLKWTTEIRTGFAIGKNWYEAK